MNPVFLDRSGRRKFILRGIVLGFFVLFVLSLALFVFGFVRLINNREAITYAEAAERYHYYYTHANDKKIALTIDDGPNPVVALRMMNILSALKAPATFFYVGEHAVLHPELVQEANKEGFTIGNHSFTHSWDTDSSYRRLSFELNSTAYVISAGSKAPVYFYRPPYLLGIGIDPTVNPYIPPAEDMLWSLKLGYLPVGSDIDPQDWLKTTKEGVLQGVKKSMATTTGHIMLFHEDIATVNAIYDVVMYLRSEGYTIVPLSELLTPPSVVALDHNLIAGVVNEDQGDISKLQWFLYAHHYLDPYALSGKFDAQTQSAVINFKIDQKLISSRASASASLVDQNTRDRILALSSPSTPKALPHLSLLSPFAGVIKQIHLNVFPNILTFLAVVVYATLILILARVLGLLILLAYRHRRGPLYGSQTVTADATFGVSILIPAFNEEENIVATVQSALNSNHARFEVIVIDDGSKDSTALRVQSFIDTRPLSPVTLIRQPNGGKSKALNHGIAKAKYEIVVVLDADAVLHPDALTHFTKHFNDTRVSAVAGRVCTTGLSRLLDLMQSLEYAVGQNIDKRAMGTIGAVGVVPGPAGAWRKEMLKRAGGFSHSTLVEDQDMTLTILHMRGRIIYEPDAIAFTETPHTLKNFLKQRFRWIYGTIQCFWKHKNAFVQQPLEPISTVALPNILIYNIILPLTYPVADSALLWGFVFGQIQTILLPFILFTLFDVLYALYGVKGEPHVWRLIAVLPLQRLVYRWLLYLTVMRSIVRALEGTGTTWNKFSKVGETQRFFVENLHKEPLPAHQLIGEEVTIALHGPSGTAAASTNLQDVIALSVSPRHLSNAGETSSPAFSPNVLTGNDFSPNTYAKSSSPLGPTSSH